MRGLMIACLLGTSLAGGSNAWADPSRGRAQAVHGRVVQQVRADRDGGRDFKHEDKRRAKEIRKAEKRALKAERRSPRFLGLDRNRNGVITRKEWRGNRVAFDRLDRNRDGVLSWWEY